MMHTDLCAKTAADKAQRAKQKAALRLAKALYRASEAAQDFQLACFEAGDPECGAEDRRFLLIASMTDYARHLESVYGGADGAC